MSPAEPSRQGGYFKLGNLFSRELASFKRKRINLSSCIVYKFHYVTFEPTFCILVTESSKNA